MAAIYVAAEKLAPLSISEPTIRNSGTEYNPGKTLVLHIATFFF